MQENKTNVEVPKVEEKLFDSFSFESLLLPVEDRNISISANDETMATNELFNNRDTNFFSQLELNSNENAEIAFQPNSYPFEFDQQQNNWDSFASNFNIAEYETNYKNMDEEKANIVQVKKEETNLEENSNSESPETKRQKVDTNVALKKKKKDMTPQELKERKKQQTERRQAKNRKTADISRKRKQAKKVTLEESLKNLTDERKELEKQSLELNAENRVLKAEYLALLSLVQSTPKLSTMFDKISELAVSQPEKMLAANTASSAASVYFLNVVFSLHQTWNVMKALTLQNNNNASNSNNINLPNNIIVN